MPDKFIIFTTPRSGSGMLCEFLSAQQNIRCRYELLKGTKIPVMEFLTEDGRREMDGLLGDDPSLRVRNRNKHFKKYLQIIENSKPLKYFGFKVFYGDHIERKKISADDINISTQDFIQYIKDNNIKIIHLTRNNIFAKYISHITAKALGYYNTKRILDTDIHPVNVVYSNFIKYKQKVLKEQKTVTKLCITNYLPYLHVTYEELTGPEYANFYKTILEFLGDDPALFTDIIKSNKQRSKKVNVFTMKEKIINFDELLEQAIAAEDIDLVDLLKSGI